MVVSNRNLLFQGSIFRCYVSFREGTYVFLRKRGGKKSYAASKLDGIRRKEARFHEMSCGGWGVEMVEMCLGYVMI